MFLVFNSVIMTIFRTQGSTCKDNDIESVEVQIIHRGLSLLGSWSEAHGPHLTDFGTSTSS